MSCFTIIQRDSTSKNVNVLNLGPAFIANSRFRFLNQLSATKAAVLPISLVNTSSQNVLKNH